MAARRSAVVAFILGRSVSTVGNNSTYVALVFAVVGVGGSPADVGLVLGASTLPRVCFALLGGVAGDTRSRKGLLIAADASMAAVQAVTAAILMSGHARVWHLVLTQALAGAAAAYSSPAQSAIMPLLAPPEDLQRLNSVFRAFKNGSAVLGPAVGGLLVTWFSPGLAIGFDAATFAISGSLMLCLPRLAPATASAGIFRDLAPGIREARARPWVGLMILSFMVYQATVQPAIYVLGPLMSPEPATATWAAILTARSVGGLAAPLVLMRWRSRRPLVFATVILLLDVPFLIGLAYGFNVLTLCLLAAVSAGAVSVADVVWETTLQQEIASRYLSRVMSLDWVGSLAAAPLGYLVIGYAADTSAPATVIMICLGLHVLVRVGVLGPRSIRAFEPGAAVAAPEPRAPTGAVSIDSDGAGAGQHARTAGPDGTAR